MVAYTNHAQTSDVKFTETPTYGRTASGYGSKLPTRYMVNYAGRWRRVYVMQYSNGGSAYIVVNGADLVLDVDTEHDIMELSE